MKSSNRIYEETYSEGWQLAVGAAQWVKEAIQSYDPGGTIGESHAENVTFSANNNDGHWATITLNLSVVMDHGKR